MSKNPDIYELAQRWSDETADAWQRVKDHRKAGNTAAAAIAEGVAETLERIVLELTEELEK